MRGTNKWELRISWSVPIHRIPKPRVKGKKLPVQIRYQHNKIKCGKWNKETQILFFRNRETVPRLQAWGFGVKPKAETTRRNELWSLESGLELRGQISWGKGELVIAQCNSWSGRGVGVIGYLNFVELQRWWKRWKEWIAEVKRRA